MLIDFLNNLLKRLTSGGIGDGEAGQVLRKLIHSPALAAIVKLTPTPVDDAILETLRLIVPLPN